MTEATPSPDATPSPVGEFAALMRRVRAGNAEAAREVFDRYSPHVLRVVRRRMHQRLRAQYDSADFAQAVWASFFADSPDRFDFDGPQALVNYLANVAANKVVDVVRRRVQAAKRDLTRERPLPAPRGGADADLPARHPTPSQVAIAEERWEQLLEGQPPRCRRVLELLREGHTHQEAADQTGIHPKVIQRMLRKLSGGHGLS
jgi:RNA polymerase sigma-70 factor (ECF subfamily)